MAREKLSGVMDKYIPMLGDMDARLNDLSQSESSQKDIVRIAGDVYTRNPDVDMGDVAYLWSRIPGKISDAFRYGLAQVISLHYVTRGTGYHHLLVGVTKMGSDTFESIDRDDLLQLKKGLDDLSTRTYQAWKNVDNNNREPLARMNENFNGGISRIYGYIELALMQITST